MDPAIGGIIGASITAAASIAGNVILVRSRAAERRRTNRVLQAIPKALDRVTQDAGKTHGYAYKARCARAKSVIEDFEGTVHMIREWHGVGVLAEDMTLNSIPCEAWASAPATIEKEPELCQWLETTGFHKHISLVPEQSGDQFRKFRIEIEGGLHKADGVIDYGFQYTWSKAACMTKEEAAEAYANDTFKKEYHCFDVRFPLGELEMEVEFPEGYDVKAYPGVFLGGSETWDDLELQRIKGGIQPTKRGASLKITDPLIGYRYLIFWVPLSRKELEELTAREKRGP